MADDDDRVEIVRETYQWYPVCLPVETFCDRTGIVFLSQILPRSDNEPSNDPRTCSQVKSWRRKHLGRLEVVEGLGIHAEDRLTAEVD